MLADYHLLRPWWLLSLLPLLGLLWWLWRQKPLLQSWSAICDEHLLSQLMQVRGTSKRHGALTLLLISGILIIIGLAGPTWSQLPVPSYHKVEPRILVLDMSGSMLTKDLTPDRLTRAKFKLHDLFIRPDAGQFGLVVFTGEPFVVSPLTEDGKTIDSLLSTLTPEIMPVDGQQLDTALAEAAKLITNAGFSTGQILVLTATPPNKAALDMSEKLKNQGVFTSIMPMVADKTRLSLFKPLALVGNGMLLPFSDTSTDLDQWLNSSNSVNTFTRKDEDIPLWRDEGRWFLLPALFFLLPVFRRGWLQRIDS